jgi:primase-polymerase (primpol)-like protein
MLVDLDHSLDPNTGHIAAWAQSIVDTLQSYTQRSVSGAGLHVLVEATVPTEAMQHGDVQMWDHARFCAMTGWHLPETPRTIEARQSQLTMVHAAHILKPKAAAQAAKATPRTAQTHRATAAALQLTDQEILTIARRAKSRADFNALWDGDASGYGSPSQADEALLCLLAFYTRVEAQLDSLFRQSGLMRPKWDKRQDYREKSIAKALATVTDSYNPDAYIAEQTAFKRSRMQDAQRRGNGQSAPPPPQEGEIAEPSTTAADGPSPPLSDYTNMLAFVQDHHTDIRYLEAWGKWLHWTGTHGSADVQGPIMQRFPVTS